MKFNSEDVLHSFVAAFEDCTLPKSKWDHTFHLAIASYYLWNFSLPEAISRIRSGIQRYHVVQGETNLENSGYHETLTIFWVYRIVEYLTLHQPHSLVDAIREITELYRESSSHKDYYSFDVLNSLEARLKWIPPDLQCLSLQCLRNQTPQR